MAHEEIEIDTDAIQRRMDGAMAALKTEFASLRTGRASAARSSSRSMSMPMAR
jgi:ribosome recycling factor